MAQTHGSLKSLIQAATQTGRNVFPDQNSECHFECTIIIIIIVIVIAVVIIINTYRVARPWTIHLRAAIRAADSFWMYLVQLTW